MTKEHEIADIVVYLKLPSREAIKRKHTTALHKLPGNQAGNMAGERAAGCCDSLPAIPLVFADGSLRTHRLSLVGKNKLNNRFPHFGTWNPDSRPFQPVFDVESEIAIKNNKIRCPGAKI